jgi:hypothetical protein
VCIDSASLPDGTSCVSGGTCRSGTCKRIVSGAFQTVFWTDDGTKTIVPGLPKFLLNVGDDLAPAALLVSDASAAGYTEFPLTVDAGKSFSVSGVPAGSYFLEMGATRVIAVRCRGGTEPTQVNVPILFELASSTPDLVSVSSARPDLAFPTSPNFANVSLDITGMDPWASGDRIIIASAQTLTELFTFFSPQPTIGATAFSGTSPWFGGLPDATKNDVIFVYQRATTSIGTGTNAASLHRATRYARRTDLTVVDGATTPATVALGAAPQTGAMSADVRNAQFAALAPLINPDAELSTFGLSVLAFPHSASYPDMPIDELTSLLSLVPSSPADANYGTLSYGQFLDPFWKEVRRVFYAFDVGSFGFDGVQAVVLSDVPASALTADPIVPVLGPPQSPRVNGKDAFSTQTGVGLQPTISWSPPALGTPSSYVVEIVPPAIFSCTNMSGQTVGVYAVIHSGTSFKVPPGLLRPELAYRARITARQAPWDALDAGPFRTGTPLHSTDCVTSPFSP